MLSNEKIEQLINNAENYKICEGCDSIVTKSTNICPLCSTYRFDDNKENVVLQIKKITDKDYISTAVTPNDFI